jgi:hypothetical protein
MDTRGNSVFKWEYGVAIGLAALLAALKLSGAVALAWLWVLAPLWIVAALVLAGTLAAAAFCRFGRAPIVVGPPLRRLGWTRRRLARRRRFIVAQRRSASL